MAPTRPGHGPDLQNVGPDYILPGPPGPEIQALTPARAGADIEPPSQLRHLLVCLDGSPHAEACLDPALALAHAHGARVTLLRVTDAVPDPRRNDPASEICWQLEEQRAGAYLDAWKAKVERSGIAAGRTLTHGPAAECILSVAQDLGVDLIVLASQGEHGTHPWGLSSTTAKVLARACTSLLVVPPGARLGKTHGITRILVPLDGSPRAETALDTAVRLAHDCRAELLLVHVASDPHVEASLFATTYDLELANELRERRVVGAEHYLGQVVRRLSPRVPSLRHLVEVADNAREALLALIEREAPDLVVLAAHGRSALHSRSCGSVAEHLMTLAKAPTLMVQDMLWGPYAPACGSVSTPATAPMSGSQP